MVKGACTVTLRLACNEDICVLIVRISLDLTVWGFTPVTRLIGNAPSNHLPVHLTPQLVSFLFFLLMHFIPLMRIFLPTLLLSQHEIILLYCSRGVLYRMTAQFLFSWKAVCQDVVPFFISSIPDELLLVFFHSGKEQHFLISTFFDHYWGNGEWKRSSPPVYSPLCEMVC